MIYNDHESFHTPFISKNQNLNNEETLNLYLIFTNVAWIISSVNLIFEVLELLNSANWISCIKFFMTIIEFLTMGTSATYFFREFVLDKKGKTIPEYNTSKLIVNINDSNERKNSNHYANSICSSYKPDLSTKSFESTFTNCQVDFQTYAFPIHLISLSIAMLAFMRCLLFGSIYSALPNYFSVIYYWVGAVYFIYKSHRDFIDKNSSNNDANQISTTLKKILSTNSIFQWKNNKENEKKNSTTTSVHSFKSSHNRLSDESSLYSVPNISHSLSEIREVMNNARALKSINSVQGLSFSQVKSLFSDLNLKSTTKSLSKDNINTNIYQSKHSSSDKRSKKHSDTRTMSSLSNISSKSSKKVFKHAINENMSNASKNNSVSEISSIKSYFKPNGQLSSHFNSSNGQKMNEYINNISSFSVASRSDKSPHSSELHVINNGVFGTYET